MTEIENYNAWLKDHVIAIDKNTNELLVATDEKNRPLCSLQGYTGQAKWEKAEDVYKELARKREEKAIRARFEKKWTYKGFPCAIAIHNSGFRCAYVDVTGTSFEKYANDNYEEADLECNGGITFGNDYIAVSDEVMNGHILGWDYNHCFNRTLTAEETIEAFKDYPKTVERIERNQRVGVFFVGDGDWEQSLETVIKDTESVVDQIIERDKTLNYDTGEWLQSRKASCINAKDRTVKTKGEER